ncbi:hypothetical protein Pint_30264 [Pistacia integerrima]|uniref:Uncharacterized protein n=1 Tax=Pistacia integerrima TaxID=434235 RepID=A0ACC0X1E7_9ROSI|nr:hypothetical protein Pint_30264 [Pistacia integerrima]
MALLLRKPKPRSLSNPSLIHLFSTSQNDNNNNSSSSSKRSSLDSFFSDVGASRKNNDSSSSKQSSLDSFFSDVRASLRKPSQMQQQQNATGSPFSRAAPSKSASPDEVRKNLSEFRQRSAVPPPPGPNPSYSDSQPSGKLSFEAIRESLRNMRPNGSSDSSVNRNVAADSLSLSAFKSSLKLKPQDGSTVIGGTQELPASVFGREMREESSGDRQAMRTEFVKIYSYGELGDKLKKLRGEGWKGGFSLEELNERLMRLREMEEKESEYRIGGVSFGDLRESLVKLKLSSDEKAYKFTSQSLDILGHLNQTPKFLIHPPKEHLVETYFHPDNMSLGEKMKIELAKVREEFKMSESDCGSARVQVAQLTTKIKYLSSVLHKKDKHSRKGLIAMVQRRKRLLTYLRRTDWDSYCFVLTNLGLRDHPDYKTKA